MLFNFFFLNSHNNLLPHFFASREHAAARVRQKVRGHERKRRQPQLLYPLSLGQVQETTAGQGKRNINQHYQSQSQRKKNI